MLRNWYASVVDKQQAFLLEANIVAGYDLVMISRTINYNDGHSVRSILLAPVLWLFMKLEQLI